MEKNYSPVLRFFIFCSGADINLLAKCPGRKEDIKYFGIGSMVLMTGIFGFISSSFAFYSIIHPSPINNPLPVSYPYVAIAGLLGMVWGAFIFLIDRAFVAGMSKNTPFSRQVLSAIPRFVLAIILSICISKPLEVLLFKSKIKEQIIKKETSSVRDKTKGTTQDLAELQTTIRNNALTIQTADEELHNPTSDQLQWRRSADSLKRVFEYDTRQKNQFYAQWLANKTIYDTLSRNDYRNAAELAALAPLVKDYNNKYKSYKKECESTGAEYQRLVKADSIEQDNKQKEHDALRNNIQGSIDVASKRTSDLNNQLTEAETKIKSADSSIYQEDFITQVIALQNITTMPNFWSINFNDENVGIWMAQMAIWMIFLIVEIAPVTMKLIMKKGEYDILDAAFYANMTFRANQIVIENNEFEIERSELEVERRKAQAAVAKAAYNYTRQAADASTEVNKKLFEETTGARIAEQTELITRWKSKEITFKELITAVSTRVHNNPLEPETKVETVIDQPEEDKQGPKVIPDENDILTTSEKMALFHNPQRFTGLAIGLLITSAIILSVLWMNNIYGSKTAGLSIAPNPAVVEESPAISPVTTETKTNPSGGDTKPNYSDKTNPALASTEKNNTATTKPSVEPKPVSKVEPSKVNGGKADPNKVDPSKINAGKVDPNRADPSKVNAGKVDPYKTDPSKATAGKVDPNKADPSKASVGKVDTNKADPGKVNAGKVDPYKIDPNKVGPDNTERPKVRPVDVDTRHTSSIPLHSEDEVPAPIPVPHIPQPVHAGKLLAILDSAKHQYDQIDKLPKPASRGGSKFNKGNTEVIKLLEMLCRIPIDAGKEITQKKRDLFNEVRTNFKYFLKSENEVNHYADKLDIH